MKAYIYSAMIRSVEDMFANQPDLAKFSEQTHDHEPNISFHLTNELWKYFTWLNCDFDVIKLEPYGNRRPDIIFHCRGNHDENLLVVEVKRKSNREYVEDWRCEEDEKKIVNHWFRGDLSYDFGISIVIDEKTQEFRFALYQREPRKRVFFPSKILENLKGKEEEIEKIINEILAIKKENKDAAISELTKQIDEIVFLPDGLTDEEIWIVEGKEN